MAQVQVQNAVNQAITRLPREVQQQGIAVTNHRRQPDGGGPV
ncbi:MAG: hypothetical protein ACLR17_06540 [Enterobacteriaceae bacterium]